MKAKIVTLIKTASIVILAVSYYFVSTSFNFKKKPECNPEPLLETANSKLKKFTLLKDYPFNFKKKKKKDQPEFLKQSITLNRGVRYKFFAVENEEFEGKPVITIYTNEKMEFLVASSYNYSSKKFYDQIEFECKTTGNYCIAFSFQDGLEGCAVGISSFLK